MLIGIRSLISIIEISVFDILLQKYHKMIDLMRSFSSFIYRWYNVIHDVDIHHNLIDDVLRQKHLQSK